MASADERTPLTFSQQLTLPIHSRRDHVIGPPDAFIALVEYGDYECPRCKALASTVEDLLDYFGGNIQYAFRHFPLSESHASAQQAAEAAEAAAAEGKFWEMHALLYDHQGELDEFSLIGYAEALHLDPRRFTLALRTERFRPQVDEDFLSGIRSGVQGTPTFFINGERYGGAYSFPVMQEYIGRILRGQA